MKCLPLARLYVSQQRNERLAGLAWRERWIEVMKLILEEDVVGNRTEIYIDHATEIGPPECMRDNAWQGARDA